MYVLILTTIRKTKSIDTEIKYVSSDWKQIETKFRDLKYLEYDCINCIDEYCAASFKDKVVQGATFYDGDKDEYYQLDIHMV